MAPPLGFPKPIESGIKKGQKQFKTLLKEERRARFDAKISAKWDRIIDSLRPEYVADQFIGKAQENIKVEGEFVSKVIKLDE